MKRTLHKIAAGLLAVCMLAGTASAAKTDAENTLTLGEKTTLTSACLQEGSTGVQEHYVSYQPQKTIRPMVVYGTTLYGRSTMEKTASYLTKDNLTMVAGINGSFFDMSTGLPLGLVITDGILRTYGTGNAVGFREDGTAVIGDPGLEIRLSVGESSVPINYNKNLTVSNGIMLYSSDYDYRTKNTINAYHVVVRPVNQAPELTMDSTMTLEVLGMVGNTCTCSIPEDGFLLAVAENTQYPSALEKLKALAMGDEVTLTVTCAEDWQNVTYACGAGDRLVTDGEAEESFTLSTAKDRRARTAVGVKQDGTVILYTADESEHSSGMTLPELAERLEELGCVDAVNLDGGGSTALGVTYPGYTSGATVNEPTDGELRGCANYIFLARQTTEAKTASRLFVYPYGGYVLPGAKWKLTVKATDNAYMAAESPENVTFTGKNAEVSTDGVVTVAANPSGNTVQIQASGGSMSATASYTILREITDITLHTESDDEAVKTLHVRGSSVTALTAEAGWYGASVYSQDSSFQWSVEGGIGTVDKQGTFTAANTGKKVTGAIVCTYGDTAVKLPVTVSPSDPFTDVKGHWAETYINELYFDGIVQGTEGKDGKLYYRPDDGVTRQEFVVMLMRYLGTDLSKFDAVQLPFADADRIASWAEPAMKAAYALGYMTGTKSGNLLYAKATGEISRQEAMTILARSRKFESDRADLLDAFSDRGDVADWASQSLAAMLEKGIISGSNGKLMPTSKVTRAQMAKMLYLLGKM